ncbi:glycerate kinase type-2 family protein [Oceanibacterium hippocampi]|uniref:Putative hydroxypyruvate reductase n=1 Tax=Oceanibacterium hippocampi TaxID=745714 RepID=A0A1Y5S926_9PROT|nr:glycerate kinase [Oceanibacterium hippocampi]SLN35242.1 Putative hydroxypyruvate reductase [Oceanibacterium hippocampi]
MSSESSNPETLARALFETAVAAADPARCLPGYLPPPPKGRTIVIGAGKAAASMAKSVEDHWPGPLSGLVITRYGHGLPTTRIEVVEASHPRPDEAGLKAARRILAMVRDLGPDDLVLCLISGGGSALLALPADGLTLDDKRSVTKALLECGATIHEINCVRKHLSAIKGGRLAAAAWPAQVVSLLISDVPGDDPATIASGPTVADPTSFAEARAVLAKYRIEAPASVAAHLEAANEESPKPGDPRIAGATTAIVATPAASLAAAATAAEAAGYSVRLIGDDLEGEARELAVEHARLALAARREGGRVAILSGGETTVTVTGHGRGGRNAEYLLSLTIALDGAAGIHAVACDTDGIDGSEDNAGAVTRPDSLARAAALGLNARSLLADNDAYRFFEALGDLIVTGPTRTNVNDFRAILID